MTTIQPRQRSTRFPVLTTKLLVPPARQRTIERPALDQRLTEGLDGRLIVISAPPGFGKTTAVVNWHRTLLARGWQLGWVALDPGDNDLARFITYITHGFGVISPEFGADTLSVLESVQGAGAANNAGPVWQVPVTVLLNELERSAVPVVLVLDDYHEIVNPDIHDALTYLIEHLPASAHLVITSRTGPPLPLPLLRARRQLTEVGVDHLRFTKEEARAFVHDVMQLDLPIGQIDELERRTEGWVAGLLLAAMSMSDSAHPEELLTSFSGAHHFVFDYLAEEVLGRQTTEIQQFLLQTSVLEQLSSQLCAAVLEGQANSAWCADMLTRLDDANLFVVRLDQNRNWYRYYHLFGEFLASRFRREDEEGWRNAHLRAARFYERERLFHQAIGHTLVAGDYEYTADLIVETGMRTVNAGRSATLQRWFDDLPEAIILQRQDLLTVRVSSLLMDRQFDRVSWLLEQADQMGDGQAEAQHRGALSAVRVSLAQLTGDLDEAIRLGEVALAELPVGDLYSRSMVTTHVGTAYRMRGDLTPAIPLLTEGMRLADEIGNKPAWLIAASQRAIAWMTLGELRFAHEAFGEIIEIEAQLGLTSFGFAIASHLGQAEILREWNQLDEAEAVLAPAISILERLDDKEQFGTKLYALLVLIRLRSAHGELQEALDLANCAISEAAESDLSDWEFERAAAFRARVLLALGMTDDAQFWANSIEPPDRPLRGDREISYQVLARLDLAQGRLHQALDLIVDARELAQASDLRRRMIELDVLCALVFQRAGEQESAQAYLAAAIEAAAPDGYLRVFLDDGSDLLPLLHELRRHQRPGVLSAQDYIDRIIAAISGPLEDPGNVATEGYEPLTEREIEVLALLAEGLSNKAVAERLFLSVGTIKRHTHNIYVKLGVNSRTQAINRGQNLGIVESG